MFDARSILDALIAGSSEQTRNVRESGGLNDIMGDLLGQMKQVGGADADRREGRADEYGNERAAPARNPLDDLFAQPGGGGSSSRFERDHGEPASGSARHETRPPAGGQPDYDDLLNRVKDLVGNNRAAAGAIVGGLGGLLLGTKTGRSIAGKAVRLGGLALIGTLAYKAYQNYQQGGSASGERDVDNGRFGVPDLPPEGSGFEADALNNDEAALFIRTMVAAAAADGEIDRDEQRRILGHLEQAGLEGEAMEFLAGEFNNPATIDDISANVRGPEQAARVYAAARLAIEPDTRDERYFLADLADRLQLDEQLVARIDATTSAIKVR